MKTLLYSHHSVGLGHLIRALRLAETLVADGPVTVICGGEIPPKLRTPAGVRLHPLPPLCMGANGQLFDPHGCEAVETILAGRARQLEALGRRFGPDVLIVEMFPFGRKKFAAEIGALIDACRTCGTNSVVCSVRDVLVTKRADQARFDQRAVGVLNREFDALLVHADPAFVDLEASLSTYRDIRIPIHYTGYITARNSASNSPRIARAVVSAGGGRVGQRLVEVAARAAVPFKRRFGLDTLIVTGSLGAPPPPANTRKQCFSSIEFSNDLPRLMAESSLSISQCGYNTAADVLRIGTPSVLVPYETPREDEQRRRADRFAARALGVVVREANLTVDTLIEAADLALKQVRQRRFGVDTNGAMRTGKLIRAMVGHA